MKQEEENFNRIIREKLEQFNADNSPEDWQLMKRKLLISKLLRIGGLSALISVFSLTFFMLGENKISIPTTSSIVAALPNLPKINESKTPEIKQIPEKIIPKNEQSNTQNLKHNPVFPELINETTEKIVEPITEIKVNKIASRKISMPVITNDLAEKEIRFIATSQTSMSDKISKVRALGKTYELTSYEALDRNIDKWKNVVIVCDITSTMFPYTTQVFDWMMENTENTTIKGIVFFTDCDSLGKQTRGRLPGKMFSVRKKDELLLWDTMFAAISNTENNKDKPENNIEALLYAQKQFPEADEFVMIVDNSSEVKDMRSLSKIKKKVHVILCGETYQKNYAFQSDFVEIAKKTKGSIHTIEDDIENVSKVKEMSVVRVGNIYFRFHKGKFYTTKFLARPTPNP